MYGLAPPLIVPALTVAVFPLHIGEFELADTLICESCSTVIDAVAEQPLVMSVTVTLYVFGANPVIVFDADDVSTADLPAQAYL